MDEKVPTCPHKKCRNPTSFVSSSQPARTFRSICRAKMGCVTLSQALGRRAGGCFRGNHRTAKVILVRSHRSATSLSHTAAPGLSTACTPYLLREQTARSLPRNRHAREWCEKLGSGAEFFLNLDCSCACRSAICAQCSPAVIMILKVLNNFNYLVFLVLVQTKEQNTSVGVRERKTVRVQSVKAAASVCGAVDTARRLREEH